MSSLPEMSLWRRKNKLNCGSHSHVVPDRGIFFEGFFNTPRRVISPKCLLKNLLDLRENFVIDVSLDKKVTIMEVIHVRIWTIRIRTLYPHRIRLGGVLRSPTAIALPVPVSVMVPDVSYPKLLVTRLIVPGVLKYG